MAFGKQSGPPASARQMQQLSELLGATGHTGLRDARGPLGLTQRQAGGKFTREEADALIALLAAQVEQGESEPRPADVRRPSVAVSQRVTEQAKLLSKLPVEALAAELQSRGWIVMEP